MVAPVGRGHGLAGVTQIVEPEVWHPSLAPRPPNAWRTASPRIGRPSRPTKQERGPAGPAWSCAEPGPAKHAAGSSQSGFHMVFGSASNAAPVASSSTRLRRTVTTAVVESTSARRKPRTSPPTQSAPGSQEHRRAIPRRDRLDQGLVRPGPGTLRDALSPYRSPRLRSGRGSSRSRHPERRCSSPLAEADTPADRDPTALAAQR